MKRSQIKMGETLAVLVIFFFLLVFGFTFYVRIQKVSFESQLRKQSGLKAVEIAQRASFLPELQCAFKNVQVDNCIDLLKLDVYSTMLENNPDTIKLAYYDSFESSNITIQQLYPPSPDAYHVLYERVLPEFGSRQVMQIPMALYNATAKEYYIGIMTVEVFSE